MQIFYDFRNPMNPGFREFQMMIEGLKNEAAQALAGKRGAVIVKRFTKF